MTQNGKNMRNRKTAFSDVRFQHNLNGKNMKSWNVFVYVYSNTQKIFRHRE